MIFPQLGMSDNTNLPTMRIRKGLIFYIEKMANNPYCSLSEAKSAYDNQLEQERREEEQRQLEAEEAMDEWKEQRREQKQNSSGGILSTALGVSLGNKLSNSNGRRDGKRDLFGTAVCQRCNSRDPRSQYTCIGCPSALYCTKDYN